MTHPALPQDYQSIQPSPPTNLCIQGITFDSALLGFTQPTGPPISTYRVVVNGPNGPVDKPIHVKICGLALKNLQPATTYTVTVCSESRGLSSSPSKEYTFRTLGDSGAMLEDSTRTKQLEDQVVELRNQVDQLQVQVQRLQTENQQWRTVVRKFVEESELQSESIL